MIISLHMPKTAGASFLASLESHFGPSLVRVWDWPMHVPRFRRNARAAMSCLLNGLRRHEGVPCFHGHFLPLKYALRGMRGDVRFVTWMREPVERAASHYYYWQRNYDPPRAPRLHKRMMEEGWSLERFCLGQEFRNMYSQFLWSFPLRRFCFVGITEHYEDDFLFFCREILDSTLESTQTNTNPDHAEGLYIKDEDLRTKIERHHALDMELYRRALAMRETRSGLASSPPATTT